MVSEDVTSSDGFKWDIFSILNGLVWIFILTDGTFNSHFFSLNLYICPILLRKEYQGIWQVSTEADMDLPLVCHYVAKIT